MKDNVSFYLIISFNFNGSGFKIEKTAINRELTRQYYAINQFKKNHLTALG